MNATLPKPKLGDVTAITIASPDLDASLKFYQMLGFRELFRADYPFNWIQITDGALLIMLREGMEHYCALTYYVREMDRVAKELEDDGIAFSEKKSFDIIKRNMIISPDKVKVSLVTFVDGFVQPEGPTMLTMPQADYFNPDKYVNKVCGMYGEFAQPVTALDQSISFWEKLGFVTLSKFTSPYPWAIMSDGLAIVGLHQTDSFSDPTITFFAADMKDKIERLKAEGLVASKESGPSNVTVKTPEGQYINLYKLGI